MYRIRLVKGLSYTDGKISATRKKPDVLVEEKADVLRYVGTGFFVLAEEQVKADTTREETAAQEGTDDIFDDDLFQEPEELEKPDLTTELQKRNVDDLKAYAKVVGVDLTGLSKKQDIINRIVENQVKTDAARAALREG